MSVNEVENNPDESLKQAHDVNQYVTNNAKVLSSVKRDSNKLRSQIRRIEGKRQWLVLAKSLRAVVDKTLVWRFSAVLIGSTLIAGIPLAITHSLIVGALFAALGMAGMSCLMFYPADTSLPDAIDGLNVELQRLRPEWELLHAKLAELNDVAGSLQAQSQLNTAAIESQKRKSLSEEKRRQLAAEGWSKYRDTRLQQFLIKVFNELGYVVETATPAGNKGTSLIIVRSGKRMIVQIKGTQEAVNTGPIQEVLAGRHVNHCDGCAVITNSQFILPAVQLARQSHCVLVSEHELPDLILGRMDLDAAFSGKNE